MEDHFGSGALLSAGEAAALQTRLKPYLDAVSLSIDATGIHADFSALDSRLAAEYLADKPQAFIDRFELIQYAGQGLRAMGWSGEQTLAQWIAQAEAAGDWATIRAAMGSHFTATPTTGNDISLGTSAGESLNGQSGNDHLLGAGGKDSLWGSDGDDILDGGTGDDKLYGGAGSDVYAFGRGSGFDWIGSDSAANAAGDAIQLAAGITAGDVELRRYGDNLDVIIKRADGSDPGIHSTGNTTERIVVEGYFTGSKINRIDFADGSVWNQAAIEARFIHYGLAGNDALSVASTLTNRVRALGGNDSVFGGTGNDTLKAMAVEPQMTRRGGKQQAAYVRAGFPTATLETLAHEAGHYGRRHRLQQGAAR